MEYVRANYLHSSPRRTEQELQFQHQTVWKHCVEKVEKDSLQTAVIATSKYFLGNHSSRFL